MTVSQGSKGHAHVAHGHNGHLSSEHENGRKVEEEDSRMSGIFVHSSSSEHCSVIFF